MILYFPQAEAELIEAARYYEDRQTGLGNAFLQVIYNAVERIAASPRRWPIFKKPMRRHLVTKYPFGIIYIVHHEDIVVVAIAHLNRHPTYWMERVEGPSSDS